MPIISPIAHPDDHGKDARPASVSRAHVCAAPRDSPRRQGARVAKVQGEKGGREEAGGEKGGVWGAGGPARGCFRRVKVGGNRRIKWKKRRKERVGVVQMVIFEYIHDCKKARNSDITIMFICMVL